MEPRMGILFLLTALVPLALSATPIYFMNKKEMAWSEARAYCQANFIDMASIRSVLDTNAIQSLFLFYNISTGAWIGLYNPQSWRWSMGSIALGSFTSWDISEPNNNGGKELCASMSGGGWLDNPCELSLPFVCFDETKTGNDRYVFINDMMNWIQAQSYCRANHTDLVSIQDAAEFSTVANIMTGDSWIGLYKDDWKWMDMTDKAHINWSSNQPDNYYGNESCGDIYDSVMSDEPCTDLRPVICYTYPRPIQMIQLKIESNQDVNNPTLKTAILDQIKQMFMMHGLPHITRVTWKIHQDGVVFKKLKISV